MADPCGIDPRLAEASRPESFTFYVDDEPVAAHPGETVAMALWAAGRATVRRSAKLGAPRGIFCNMGICYDCLVYRDGVALRACMALAEAGVRYRSWGPEDLAGAAGATGGAP